MRIPVRSLWTLALAVMLLTVVGCDDSGDEEPSISMFLTDVRVSGTSASLESGPFPTDGTAPAPTVNGSTQIVRGGSLILQVAVPDDADELLLGLDGEEGYYRIDLTTLSAATAGLHATVDEHDGKPLPLKVQRLLGTHDTPGSAGKTALTERYTVVLTSASSADYPSLPLNVAARVPDDGLTAPAEYTVAVNETAATSGQLQVSLNWDQPVDLDLHVETPNGEDIFYGNETGQNGGTLDLDSNAACGIDNINNENITWGDATPASGDYTVRVDLWSSCNVDTDIAYVVTINVCGAVQTYDGTFDPSDADRGGAFDGRVITTLDGLSFPCASS
ncbi:MAG: hypothetical protein GVY18_08835 [Bacteroidetes bacterium]|jgi:hypothetical protein|nr:hypothetical protein [Bacteroidota bacterium]